MDVRTQRLFKVRKVKAWLRKVFSGHEIQDFEDTHTPGAFSFRIRHTEYSLFTLTEDFLDEQLDNDAHEIAMTLQRLGIEPRLRTAGRYTRIIVSARERIQEESLGTINVS
jgi:hypothetical protein